MTSTRPAPKGASKSDATPLSFAQERLWFLEQINPGDLSASICRAVRIKGDLNLDLLQQSLQAVVDRHEALRTTFATTQLNAGVDSKPVQLVATNRVVDVELVDLSDVRVEQQEVKARDVARGKAQRSFDLTLGPLLKATLLRLKRRDHVLLLNLHRIICDEHSVKILLRDLREYYRALTNGQATMLPVLPTRFTDFAASEREKANSEQIHSDYWKKKLAGAPGALELPLTKSRPPVQSWRGESVRFEIQKPLYQALESLNVDLFATLTTAFQILLFRYSGQQDVVLGTTASNRELPETRDLIGPLANPIALRTDLSGNPTFGQLLERVKEEILSARAHSLLPFAKLIEELQVERSLSHSPVFQIAINLKDRADSIPWIEGLLVENFEFETGIASLDLKLEIVADADGCNCRFEYASDLFERETIERLADHFVKLLAEIAKNPEESIRCFNFLGPEELDKLLREWNNTATTYSNESVCRLFESQVKQRPDAVAVEFEDTSLTYDELNRKANQLAHYLQERGVGSETLTGVFFDRSVEMVVALLGILKAGGAYLPLDISYPAERLAFMLNDAAVPVVLTRENLLPLLPKCAAKVICLDKDYQDLTRQSDINPVAQITGEALAYVIYTSGSTGRPKGVQVSHSALVNFLHSMRERPGISAAEVLLSVTTLSFDIAGLEIYLPLTVGARLVIAPREVAVDGAALVQLMSQCDPTVMQATPATWRLLLESGWKGDAKLRILCGGEALSRDLANQLLEKGAELWNLYGPTETTIWSTLKRVSRPVGEITIGKPIANTQIYIVDSQMQPVPIGVAGELYIGGRGLSRGYLHQPGLTAERFLPNPFSGMRGERLYRTGDLARFNKAGEIEVLGRLDHQVKVRGYRIELGEIETVLNSHRLVLQSVVTTTPDASGEQQLTGYFIPDEKVSDSLRDELRDHLKARLPDYMIPHQLVMLETFPLTPNGKIDRKQLPNPHSLARNGHATYVAPRDSLEKQLANMWQDVLRIDRVGLNENFFELGGHSLLAARLFAQIENRFGKHLPLSALFQSPTIEQLANVLRDSVGKRAWTSLVAIQPEGSRPPLFCIHAAGANVLIYRPLSQHFGNDQPVYALQAQGLDGQTQPLTTVEDMAARYIEEMRAFQPEGPYHLLGASFGGLVIYEMSYQLSRQGHNVGLVAMLNTNCPVYTFSKRVASHVVHFREQGPRFYGKAVIDGVMRRINKYVPLNNSTSGQGENGAAPDPELRQVLEANRDRDEALVRTVFAILRAQNSYDPTGRFYPGKVTLFRAIHDRQQLHDNRLGWRHLAQGGFEVHDVPGTHTSMREEPNVAVLVEKLKPCLEKAQS